MIEPLYVALVSVTLILLRSLLLAAEAGLAATARDALREGGAGARTLAAFDRLKARPEATFAALRASNVLLLALASTSGAVSGAVWARTGQVIDPVPVLWGLLAGGVATAVIATVFDLVARAFASANPAGISGLASLPVEWIVWLSAPSLSVVARVLDWMVHPLGARASFGPPRPPLEDLERLLVEEARQQGMPQAPKLIRNIFQMSEKTARDVMVPRTQVVALDIAEPPTEILRMLAEHGHSRMPVYKGEIDNIVGILHARDLVPMLQHPEVIVVQDIVRPAHFVPWSKPVNEILREMQKKHIHMALVVDEYGGFLGVLTLEDVLEVIVGDIQDEYEDDVPNVEPLPDGSFLVRASMFLDDFEKSFAVNLPEGDFETVGGFLNSLAGSIPENGDKFFFGGLEFTVQDRTPRRIRRVRVQKVAAGSQPPEQRKRKSS